MLNDLIDDVFVTESKQLERSKYSSSIKGSDAGGTGSGGDQGLFARLFSSSKKIDKNPLQADKKRREYQKYLTILYAAQRDQNKLVNNFLYSQSAQSPGKPKNRGQ